MAEYKPTVVFDFDGVIHSYKSGWQGAEVVNDPVVPGIADVISALRRNDIKVVVVSTRCNSAAGMGAVRKYLRDNSITVDDVMAEKPPAICYVDDRAICFKGDSSTLFRQITQFKSWTEGSIRNDLPVRNLRPCKAISAFTGEELDGHFHSFESNGEEVYAVVETEDGSVHLCYVEIKFTDRTQEASE